MAIKISTALRNYMLGAGSFQQAFADSHILLYSGSPPATADLGVTGTHLLTVTKASGTLAAGALSTPDMYKALVTVAGGQTIGITILGTTTGSYAALYSGSQKETMLALANLINRKDPHFMAAVEYVDTAAAYILLTARAQGNNGATIVVNNTGTTGGATCTVTASTTFALSTGLNFATPTVGTIDKPAAVWSGLGLTAAGTGTSAGYWRLMRSDDTGAVDSTPFLYERVQGTVGTSGSDLVLSSVTIVSGATTTIDGFKFTLPETV